MHDAQAFLRQLYDTAVATAHPAACLARHLPAVPPDGRLIVLAAGKAAAAMAVTAEHHYAATGGLDRIIGCVTPPEGYVVALAGAKPRYLPIFEGHHPIPDASSEIAARRALELATSATPADDVLVLLSGGASALWSAPAGMSLADKTALTRGLLKSGADIHEMNTVRRHLSRIKGGRLAVAARAARRILTLAISDVPGDDPGTIGSGPTVPDATSLADARGVLEKLAPRMAALGLDAPASVRAALLDPVNETPKPGDPAFAHVEYRIIVTPRLALDAAAAVARARGYDVVDLGDAVTGEARDVAAAHARLAREVQARGRPAVILSGGELEVTVRHRDSNGRGGRSQEYALALAVALEGARGIAALAADTDGIDGGRGLVTDPAGAIVDGGTVAAARARGIDAAAALEYNDTTPFFAHIAALVQTGPTQTNVNDFRAIVIDTDA